MLKSQIVLMLLLATAPFAYADNAVMPEQPSEQEMQLLVDQVNQALELIREVGGLYIVNVENIPLLSKNKIAITRAITHAAKSEHCDELFESPEGYTIVLKGQQGKLEAQKLIKELEKLDCKAELLEIN